MKHNWTYKKLGEVATLTGGFTPKAGELFSEGKYPYFKVSDMNTAGNEVVLTKTPSFVVDSKKCYPQGAIVFPKNGAAVSTNKKRILGQDSIVDLNTCAAILNSDIDIKFAYYWFYNLDFKTLVRGGALPTLDLKGLRSLQFPIPSLDEQKAIVAELDGINRLIELQEEQLREYDRLAQSLFYSTFGDPATNPKGWEVKLIGEIGNVERGAGISKKDFVPSGSPCIHYGQLHTVFGPYTTRHISCIPNDLIAKPRIAHPNDVVMAITSEDVEGSCKSTAWMGDYDVIVGSDAAILHHSQNGVYVSYYTQTKAFYIEKEKYANGFKVTHISAKDIESIPIMCPPLALQQSFAAQIEAIEQQKALIRRSLDDTRTLLAARMQYYFE